MSSKEVEFAILDKIFAGMENTTLIQRNIISMTLHFPEGMNYGDIPLGNIFQVGGDRINHLINDLDGKPKDLLIVTNRQSRWRKIFLNPENPVLLKLAEQQQKDCPLICSEQQSEKCLLRQNHQSKTCLLCYFHQSKNALLRYSHRSTTVVSPKSIKEYKYKEGIDAKASGSGNKHLSSHKLDGTKRFIKPTPAEVTEYAASLGYQLAGEQFCDYYESKGWLIGKSPMKSWQAAVRTWKRNNSADETKTTEADSHDSMDELIAERQAYREKERQRVSG